VAQKKGTCMKKNNCQGALKCDELSTSDQRFVCEILLSVGYYWILILHRTYLLLQLTIRFNHCFAPTAGHLLLNRTISAHMPCRIAIIAKPKPANVTNTVSQISSATYFLTNAFFHHHDLFAVIYNLC
jgi:hypothetical protein